MFTSDVRIPEFWIHISSARHFASTLTPASAITHFTVTSFAACDKAYCNLDDRLLVLFAMSFLDTRILFSEPKFCTKFEVTILYGCRNKSGPKIFGMHPY